MVYRGVYFPHKNGPIPLRLDPHMMTLKFSLNLYALPNPINMTTIIGQHTKLPPTATSPGKPDHQAIHCPTLTLDR